MSLWSILPSPLIFGGNVQSLTSDTTTGPWTTALLTNEEVLAVNQDALGTHAKRITQSGTTEVWARDCSGSRKAVALFNRGTADATVSVTFSQLGVSGTPSVRDVWNRANVTGMTTGISVKCPLQRRDDVRASPPGTGGSGGAGARRATAGRADVAEPAAARVRAVRVHAVARAVARRVQAERADPVAAPAPAAAPAAQAAAGTTGAGGGAGTTGNSGSGGSASGASGSGGGSMPATLEPPAAVVPAGARPGSTQGSAGNGAGGTSGTGGSSGGAGCGCDVSGAPVPRLAIAFLFAASIVLGRRRRAPSRADADELFAKSRARV